MTGDGPANLSASVHARLLNRSKAEGRTFNDLLQLYALERFLVRLSASPHGKSFTLKGALLLRAWDHDLRRTTRDIDLLGRIDNDAAAIEKVMRAVCDTPVEPDGMTFDRTTVRGEAIVEDADYEGVRIRLEGRLGNARVPVQIDVGFGDIVIGAVRPAVFPTILDMAPPNLAMYPPETAIAEKLQVMLQRGEANSRMKDFHDIWWMSRKFEFEGGMLARAVQMTCEHRATRVEERPTALSAEFAALPAKRGQWKAFRQRLEASACPEDFGVLMRELGAFLAPVVGAIARGQKFDRRWPSGGPWE